MHIRIASHKSDAYVFITLASKNPCGKVYYSGTKWGIYYNVSTYLIMSNSRHT